MDFFFIVEFKNEGIDQKRSYMKRKALSLLLASSFFWQRFTLLKRMTPSFGRLLMKV